jgi:hypothetical protein
MILTLALCLLMFQNEEPQLVWEGEVDGSTLVRIHGDRVDLEPIQGLPVQRQRFRFNDRLPDQRQNVRMEVVEGRGDVRIVEQPRPENNYTLAIRIEDRQGGRSFYSLAFFWERRGGRSVFGGLESGPRRTSGGETVWWSGRVDGEAIVSCSENSCVTEATSGREVTGDRFRFSRRMPRRDLTVTLEETDGRGDIRLVEQPRDSNDYTARVRIRDHQGGAGQYTFTLAWTPPARSEQFDFARPGMVWRGRVDGRVRVTVSGRDASAEVLGGQPVRAERAQFSRALPNRNNPNATVRRVEGRGRVEIVEYPSNRNGHRLVFEIDDRDGGADDYVIEVGW